MTTDQLAKKLPRFSEEDDCKRQTLSSEKRFEPSTSRLPPKRSPGTSSTSCGCPVLSSSPDIIVTGYE